MFDTPLDGTTNVDTVRDFKSGQDKLVLSDVIFTNLAPGPLSAAQWVASPGAQAQDGNDYVLYNTTTGQLSYDADGNGAGAAIAFATLFGTPSLAATDILVGDRLTACRSRLRGARPRECPHLVESACQRELAVRGRALAAPRVDSV